MRFQPGRSGNPAGRPPKSEELRAVLRHNGATIAKLLPHIQLRAHDLLRLAYTDERLPLPIRLQAAIAAVPVENAGLSCAEFIDDMRRRTLAAKPAPPAPEILNAADYIE